MLHAGRGASGGEGGDHVIDSRHTPRPRVAGDAPHRASRLAHRLGWPLAIAWVALFGGYVLWQLWTEAEILLEQLILVGAVFGVGLLFLRVLLDRLDAMKTDRYREVKK